MELSILIVNWNTREHLRKCLQSVRDTAGKILHEVIVVDNASEDGSASMVRSEFPEVNLLEPGENLGFAKGNNLAYSKCSGRYVLIMNPDVVLLEGTLAGLMAFADAHPDAGLSSPKLLNPDLTAQIKYYGRLPSLTAIFFIYTRPGSTLDSRVFENRFRKKERYERSGDFSEPLSFTDGGAAFCCTLVPRRLIETHGFLDERFPVFFNDGDFASRLFRAGYRAYIIPQVQACHSGGASVERLDLLSYNREFIYGLRAYCRKHRGRLYGFAVDALLSLNMFHDLGRNVRDILKRKKAPGEMITPVRDFLDVLVYTPPNAADHQGERPKGGRNF